MSTTIREALAGSTAAGIRRPEIEKHIKPPTDMAWPGRGLSYKVGDLNSSHSRCRSNLNSLLLSKAQRNSGGRP